jgi:predicted nucleic acid-binding protein
MLLAVDASTLVAEALRARGRQLLAHRALDLIMAGDAWSEMVHELRRRVILLTQRGHLPEQGATVLLDDALAAVQSCVEIVPAELYADQMEEALRRIPRDHRDAPTVALALALDCGIWTGDQDFFGCGLPVWITETLLTHVGNAS